MLVDSLMLHYHLSILMLVDIIEATDRYDLLSGLAEINAEAENAVMNALAFGLHNTFTLTAPASTSPGEADDYSRNSVTVPLVSIDPYPHHVVASVQLIRKAIDRDLLQGKITDESHANVLLTLEAALNHLPQCSKSVQAARIQFSEKSATDPTVSRQDPYVVLNADSTLWR